MIGRVVKIRVQVLLKGFQDLCKNRDLEYFGDMVMVLRTAVEQVHGLFKSPLSLLHGPEMLYLWPYCL